MSAPLRLRAPHLDGATAWLNTQPLERGDLAGRVVLVNFWTFTCINWLRQEPYVRAWAETYRDDGLVVIGVHTPEFSFEHDPDGVRRAVVEHAIDYPVVIDNDLAIWEAFANHYWPALYFVDGDGVIRHQQFGEGRYEQSEQVLQDLLGVDRPRTVVLPTGVEAQADWSHLGTPETYLGHTRGTRFVSESGVDLDRSFDYAVPERLPSNSWALDGAWTIGPERSTADRAGAGLACSFEARDAHLVLNGSEAGPITFQVLVDGERPGESRGVDVDEDGRGVLTHGRLHNLFRATDEVIRRTLTVTFDAPGAEAYALTFG